MPAARPLVCGGHQQRRLLTRVCTIVAMGLRHSRGTWYMVHDHHHGTCFFFLVIPDNKHKPRTHNTYHPPTTYDDDGPYMAATPRRFPRASPGAWRTARTRSRGSGTR